MTKAPEGKAPNLIVFVHGCCTDQNAVNQLKIQFFDAYKNAPNTGQWEFVVWDWHEYTPQPLPGVFDPATIWKNGADAAYEKAPAQGAVLASAIALFPYQYVHLIGHSSGAKLIQDAATAYIGDYFVRQTNPFIYLTFLDAYAPNDVGKTGTGSYGSLPGDYPNHYSEQYVDKADWPFTEACLSNAFNFDITGWRINAKACPLDPNYLNCAHGWPVTWYKNSITSAPPTKFIYGYPLSLEGGDSKYTALSKTYLNGKQCALNSIGTYCAPAACW